MDTKRIKKIKKSPKEEEIQGSASIAVSFDELFEALLDGYGKKDSRDAKIKFNSLFSSRLKQIASKHGCHTIHNILIIFDNTTLYKSDADRVYLAVSKLENARKPLLLILQSGGGEPGSAYLIGRLCREHSSKFIVSVPRWAKSAATLLSTAADEIHMGSLSELGPIDLQINGMPALGLKNSIEHIAEIASKYPDSSAMFAKYLAESVKPVQIGYYERAVKSVEQYAIKLLESHKATVANSIEEIAHKLVHEYKDHGFVIDSTEAEKIFGRGVIKKNSPEYSLSNEIYAELAQIEEYASLLGYKFIFYGTFDSEPVLFKKK